MNKYINWAAVVGLSVLSLLAVARYRLGAIEFMLPLAFLALGVYLMFSVIVLLKNKEK